MTPDEQKDALAKLRDGLSIDINALHYEARAQPDLADKAGQVAAEAKAEAKKAKMRREIAEAEAEKAIRDTPEYYGITKVTESSVRAAVVLLADVQAAKKIQIDAEKESDMAASIANAYEHRRSSLKIEAELYKANYWGDDVDADTRTAGREQAERGVGEVRKRRRRRKADGDGD